MTFPRSGHHLLQRTLYEYFNSHPPPESRGFQRGEVFTYCEFYGHCRQYPCPDPKTRFQKNHDFRLARRPVPGSLTVVQYRTPFESIVSYFRYACRHEGLKASHSSWKKFAYSMSAYWRGFVSKWAISPPTADICKVAYHDLLHHPVDVAADLVTRIVSDGKVDRDRLADVVAGARVARRHSVQDFEYFDSNFATELESALSQEMKALKLPRAT